MNLSTDPYVWIAAILTLSVFSFLYKDNPLFALVEHLLVGLSGGYVFVIYWHNVFLPELIEPLVEDGLGAQAHLWVPVLLCFLWAGKYMEKTQDLYRLALAFWVSVDMGLTIPAFMEARVLSQVAGTLQVNLTGTWDVVLGNIVLVAGTVAALVYFVFTKAHRGIIGKTATVGSWIIMIGFGATFSYTILSRVYILIGRILFLLRDWLGIVT